MNDTRSPEGAAGSGMRGGPSFEPGSPINPLPGTRLWLGRDLENLTAVRLGLGELIALAEPGEDTSEAQASRTRATSRIEAIVRAGREGGLLSHEEAAALVARDDRAAADVARVLRWADWPGFGPDGRRLR